MISLSNSHSLNGFSARLDEDTEEDLDGICNRDELYVTYFDVGYRAERECMQSSSSTYFPSLTV